MIKSNNKIHYLIYITIFLHAILINLHPVNFEYVFFEAHNFINDNFNKDIVFNFFKQQANTFFFSFIISFFSFIFPFAEPIYIGKLISILSYLFIGLSVINILTKNKNIPDHDKFRFTFYLLLVANPIIWVFGYRSTPDLISMAIGLYGFSIFYVFEKKKKDILFFCIPSFLIGFATTLKPIVGIYLIASISILEIKFTNQFLKKLILICLTYSIVPLIYFLLVYINFKFFLFTDYYKEVLSVVNNSSKYLSNLILYTSFLFFCLLPIISGAIFNLLRGVKIFWLLINVLIILLVFFVGNKFLSLSVEMSFGLFDQFISMKILRGVLSVVSYIFVLFLLYELKKLYKNKDLKTIKLLCVGILYILIVSSSLASQRYLIVIVPLFYLIFKLYCNNKINYLFVAIICIPANIILIGNQYLTGSLSFKIIQKLKQEKMIDKICVGAIGSHVSHYFTLEDRLAKNCVLKDFHIINGINSESIYSVEGKFLILNKSYSVIKVR